jgi:hypothetical protein
MTAEKIWSHGIQLYGEVQFRSHLHRQKSHNLSTRCVCNLLQSNTMLASTVYTNCWIALPSCEQALCLWYFQYQFCLSTTLDQWKGRMNSDYCIYLYIREVKHLYMIQPNIFSSVLYIFQWISKYFANSRQQVEFLWFTMSRLHLVKCFVHLSWKIFINISF